MKLLKTFAKNYLKKLAVRDSQIEDFPEYLSFFSTTDK